MGWSIAGALNQVSYAIVLLLWWRFVNPRPRVDSPFHLSFAFQRGTDEVATECPALSWWWCSPRTVRSFRHPLVNEELPSRYDCNHGRVHVVTLPNHLFWLAHVTPTKITFHAVVFLIVDDAQNEDGDTVFLLHWTVRTELRERNLVRVLIENECRPAILNNYIKHAIDVVFGPMAFIYWRQLWQLR